MKDAFAAMVVAQGDDPIIEGILEEVCEITQMGFAAVARVTDQRWIACQVLDKIEFGLKPGDELALKTTICDEIRQCGQRIVIDDVDADAQWRTHHTPALYGFKSYASLPIVLDDGSFFGTLCAIDPKPRMLSGTETIAALEALAWRAAAILSARRNVSPLQTA